MVIYTHIIITLDQGRNIIRIPPRVKYSIDRRVNLDKPTSKRIRKRPREGHARRPSSVRRAPGPRRRRLDRQRRERLERQRLAVLGEARDELRGERVHGHEVEGRVVGLRVGGLSQGLADVRRVARLDGEDRGRRAEVRLVNYGARRAQVRRDADALEHRGQRDEVAGRGHREGEGWLQDGRVAQGTGEEAYVALLVV